VALELGAPAAYHPTGKSLLELGVFAIRRGRLRFRHRGRRQGLCFGCGGPRPGLVDWRTGGGCRGAGVAMDRGETIGWRIAIGGAGTQPSGSQKIMMALDREIDLEDGIAGGEACGLREPLEGETPSCREAPTGSTATLNLPIVCGTAAPADCSGAPVRPVAADPSAPSAPVLLVLNQAR